MCSSTLNVDILEIKCNTVPSLQNCSSTAESMCVCGKETENENGEGKGAGVEVAERFILMPKRKSEPWNSTSHQSSACGNMGARRQHTEYLALRRARGLCFKEQVGDNVSRPRLRSFKVATEQSILSHTMLSSLSSTTIF